MAMSRFICSRGEPPILGFDGSSFEFLGIKGHLTSVQEGGNYAMSHLRAPSNPSNSSSSNGHLFGALNSPLQETLPFAYIEPRIGQGNRPLNQNYLKIAHEENCNSWIEAFNHNCQLNHLNSKSGANSSLAQHANLDKMKTVYGPVSSTMKDSQHGEEWLGFLLSDATSIDNLQEGGRHDIGSKKRPYMGDGMQENKKHCGNGSKKSKVMAKPTPFKDTQGIAAKNRRERISKRLKTLQEIVPNGTKVDMVTMLEKAISYVKFLQLQVEVLAADEFWPSQGGKAPEVAQVKETIDAILSSHRVTNSSQYSYRNP